MLTFRPRGRHVLLATACALAALSIASIGRIPIRLHPQAEVLVSRGALELAMSDYNVRSRRRDSWLVSTPSGMPGFTTSLPPRSFLCPTVSRETLALYNPFPTIAGPVMKIAIIHVPLVVPTLLVAIAAAWIWIPILRRKRRPDVCKCGYDLTGNASGVCPECGAAVPAGPAATASQH